MGKKKKKAYKLSYGSDAVSGERFTITERYPLDEGQRLIRVYVEGYEDVAFWRGVFDDFESEKFTFEISVPLREDLAKGKRVVLNLASANTDCETLFCVDSDFDYLFADQTETARTINHTPQIFHTYAYAIENYLCYAPSLHNICVKATKNDISIFDFEEFFERYSEIIWPLFVWYAYSAQISTPCIFTLTDFKSSVKLNYLEIDNNGEATLAWLEKQVGRRLHTLRQHNPEIEENFPEFTAMLAKRGVTPQTTYLYMQGHTLMDNVVMPVLDAVCDRLRSMSLWRISNSRRRGVSLANEQSNYRNALEDIRSAILFNENYKDCPLYEMLKKDIKRYLDSLSRNSGR